MLTKNPSTSMQPMCVVLDPFFCTRVHKYNGTCASLCSLVENIENITAPMNCHKSLYCISKMLRHQVQWLNCIDWIDWIDSIDSSLSSSLSSAGRILSRWASCSIGLENQKPKRQHGKCLDRSDRWSNDTTFSSSYPPTLWQDPMVRHLSNFQA